MQRYLKILQKNICFGLNDAQTEAVCSLLQIKPRSFGDGEVILCEGSNTQNIGVLLSGEAFASRTDINGRQEEYTKLVAGDIFGEALAFTGGMKSPVGIYSCGKTEVAFFSKSRLSEAVLDSPESAVMLSNLASELSNKFFSLQRRLNCVLRPSLRDKVLEYLNTEAKNANSRCFTIPLDRFSLAVYLNSDRAALSRCLSKLKAEKIIDYKKNKFCLLGGQNNEDT